MRNGLESIDQQNSSTGWHESFEDALAEAASTGKPVLADFTGSDWCVYCTRLKSEVFDQDQFIEWANNNVVLLELDYPRRIRQSAEIRNQNAELAKRYQIESYPTVLLLAPNGEVLGRTGYVKGGPQAWIPVVDSMLRSGSVKP